MLRQRPRIQDTPSIRARLDQIGVNVGPNPDGKSINEWYIKYKGHHVFVYDWKLYDINDKTLRVNCPAEIEQEFIDFLYSQ